MLADLEFMEADYRKKLEGIHNQKIQLNQQIEEVKDNRDILQETLQELQTRRSNLKVEETQLQGQLGFEQRDANRLEEEALAAEKEIQTLQDAIEQKLVALDDRSVEVLTEQLRAAEDRQTETNQLLIRLKFELEDIDGQFEDREGTQAGGVGEEEAGS